MVFWAGNVMIHGYRKVKEGLMDFSGVWIMCAPEVKRLGDLFGCSFNGTCV
jgi:hypothetical protein